MNFGISLLGFMTTYGIKLIVMFLCVHITWMFGKAYFNTNFNFSSDNQSKKKRWIPIRPEERNKFHLLFWGIVLYVIAEFLCSIESYLLQETADFYALGHGIFSYLGMGLTAAGLFTLFDWKYFHLIDNSKPCMAITVCRPCTKRTKNLCQYQFLFICSTLLLLFMMVPVFYLPLADIPGNPSLYVLPFDSLNVWYDQTLIPWLHLHVPLLQTDLSHFYLPRAVLFLEERILPMTTMFFALITLILFLCRQEKEAVLLFMFTLGAASYVYFEAIVYGMTHEPFFGAFLHESGELFFLIMFQDLMPRILPHSLIEKKGGSHA